MPLLTNIFLENDMPKFKKGDKLVRVRDKKDINPIEIPVGTEVEFYSDYPNGLEYMYVCKINESTRYFVHSYDFESVPKGSVDWTKPVYMKSDPNAVVEVLTTTAIGEWPVVVRIGDLLRLYDLDGKAYRGWPAFHITNKPVPKKKKTVWINIYPSMPP
jgi:hypothetical protein